MGLRSESAKPTESLTKKKDSMGTTEAKREDGKVFFPQKLEANKEPQPTPEEALRYAIKKELLKENPRMEKYPHLINLATDLIHWRWTGKKVANGYIQATINHVNFGINITKEMLDECGLEYNTLQRSKER